MSSYGHIRDLSKKELGIAIDDNFKPDYEISPDKKKLVESLAKSAKEAERVWLHPMKTLAGKPSPGHLTGARPAGRPDAAHRFPRNYQERHHGRHRESAHHRHEPRQCAAGTACTRPTGRIRTLAGTLEEASNRRLGRKSPKASQCASSSSASEIMNFRSTPYYRVTAVVLPHGRPCQKPFSRRNSTGGSIRPKRLKDSSGRAGGRLPGTQQRKANLPNATRPGRSPHPHSSRRRDVSSVCRYRRRWPSPSGFTKTVT